MLKISVNFFGDRETRKVKVNFRCFREAGAAARSFLSLCKHRLIQSVTSFCGALALCSRPKGTHTDSCNVYGVFLILFGYRSFLAETVISPELLPTASRRSVQSFTCPSNICYITCFHQALHSEAGLKDKADIGTCTVY